MNLGNRLNKLFVPYQEKGSDEFLLDLVTICMTTETIPARANLTPIPDYISKIPPSSIKRHDTTKQPYISTRIGSHITVNQGLGYYKNSNGSHARIVHINLMKWLRSHLESSGVYDDSRFPAPKANNFIRRCLIPNYTSWQLLEMCLKELSTVIRDQKYKFQADLKAIFGKRVTLKFIRVSLHGLEIAFDREHGQAPFIPRALKNNFVAHFCGKAKEKYKPYEIKSNVVGASGVMLEGYPRKGEIHKLYPKAMDVIRYEVMMNKPIVNRIFRASFDLTDISAFNAAISTLAADFYKDILTIQGSFTFEPIVSPIELAVACYPEIQRQKMLEVLTQMCSEGFVRNTGGRYRRQLERFSAAGYVEHRGGGLWRLKPHVMTSMLRLGRFTPLLGDRRTTPPKARRRPKSPKRRKISA